MGRFGFWKNSNIFFQSSLDDDPEEQRRRQEQELTNHEDGDSVATIDHRLLRTSVVYGTMKQEHDQQHQSQHSETLLVGDEPRQVQRTGTVHSIVPPPQRRRIRCSSSSSDDDGSSSTTQEQLQELPSLTAAFRSIENRTIVFNCVFYLVIYLTIAVVAYSFVLEQWTIIDSLYFAVATFTTCGYGDKQPTTIPGKLFTILFAIYGVIILGVFIAIFGAFISEAQMTAMKRFQLKHQNHMIDTLFRQSFSSKRGRVGNGNHLQEETSFWNDHISLAEDIWKVLRAESPLILLVGVMAMILGLREGWDWTSTLYFCIMAATTTGYGDYTPTNQLDKLYCVLLLPLAVAVFGEILGRIANIYIARKQRVAQTKFLHRSLTLCDIRNMDSDNDGRVDLSDFMSFMLIALQKVDRRTIEELKTIYHSLDANGNGYLEEADLRELVDASYLPALQRIRKEATVVFSPAKHDPISLKNDFF